MPKNSKNNLSKKSGASPNPNKRISSQQLGPAWKKLIEQLRYKISGFLQRRPHRSLRLTKRRDYVRTLDMSGYFKFTFQVLAVLRGNWKSLALLSLIYALLSALFLGISSQADFSELRDNLIDTGNQVFDGDWSKAGQTVSLAIVTVLGGVSPALTTSQQVYSVFIGLLVWLTTVWLLRHRLAGHKVSLRDALYNAGSPLVAMIVLTGVAVIQLLPIAIAVIGVGAAGQTGVLSSGVEAMLFWLAAIGLGALSVYWLTTTIFAAIIVTNPGTYPFQALKLAGDMVIGRRLRIILRVIWLALAVAIVWLLVLVPIVALDAWIKSVWSQVAWLPIVPVTLLLLGSLSLTTCSAYVYLFYRQVVGDNAKPA